MYDLLLMLQLLEVERMVLDNKNVTVEDNNKKHRRHWWEVWGEFGGTCLGGLGDIRYSLIIASRGLVIAYIAGPL